MLKGVAKRWRRLRLSMSPDLKRPRHERDSRLVMTLLVRDEEDILEANLDHHFAMGVDFVVATDNGSVDGSVEILRRYEREGRLELLHEPAHTFRQDVWVDRMAERAVSLHAADVVFHCDADEFWHADSGNLKTELLARRRVDVLEVPVRNVLLRHRCGRERFPEDAVYAVTRPLPAIDPKGAEITVDEEAHEPSPGGRDAMRRMYLHAYPPSVIFTTHRGPRRVRIGNHMLAKGEIARVAPAAAMRIDHYPVRSFEAFARKARHGASIVENHDEEWVGWHWRRWYEALRRGRLEEEYRLLTLSPSEARALIRRGVVREIAALRIPEPSTRSHSPAPAVPRRAS